MTTRGLLRFRLGGLSLSRISAKVAARAFTSLQGGKRRLAGYLAADDAVVHCATERQAREVLAALGERMAEVGLQLHPDKTKVVYCKDSDRRGSYEHTSFTFLGFEFRGRRARGKNGRIFTSFLPAVSKDALKKMSATVRSWRLHRRTGLTMSQLAREINPVVRAGSSTTGLSASRTVSSPSAHQLLPGALAP